jgi:hypothetical protein
VPFSLGFSGSHDELVANFERVHSSLHIWIFSKAWYCIVDLSWLP